MNTQIQIFLFMHAFIIYSILYIFFLFRKIHKNNATGRPVKFMVHENTPHVSMHSMHQKVLSHFSRFKVCLERWVVLSVIKCCTVSHSSFTLTHTHKHMLLHSHTHKCWTGCISSTADAFWYFFTCCCLYILTDEIKFLIVFCPESVHHIHKSIVWQNKLFFHGIF